MFQICSDLHALSKKEKTRKKNHKAAQTLRSELLSYFFPFSMYCSCTPKVFTVYAVFIKLRHHTLPLQCTLNSRSAATCIIKLNVLNFNVLSSDMHLLSSACSVSVMQLPWLRGCGSELPEKHAGLQSAKCN